MYKLICGVLILFGAIAFAQDGAPKKPAPKRQPLALIVDLQRVVEKCDEVLDAGDKQDKMTAVKAEEFRHRVTELQQERDALLKDSRISDHGPDFYKKQKALMMELAKLKVDEEIYKVRIADDLNRILDGLWKQARTISAKIMKQRGARVVFVSRMGPIRFENRQQFQDEFVFRRILCVDDNTIDITQDVLKEMNTSYKARRKAAGMGKKPAGKPAGMAKKEDK